MTQYGPFTEVISGTSKGWLTDEHRPIPDHFRRVLGLLDEEKWYTYSIWRGGDPESIVGFRNPAGEPFVQAAGGADGITVEVRLLGPNGESRLYTIGRPEPADDSTTLIPISRTRAVRVRSNEVFTAHEAAEIFYTYYLTESVSEIYVLRELDVAQELSEER